MRESDFILPIKIFFHPPEDIIDVQIGNRTPPNLQATERFIASTGELTIDIPLLNPGDSVQFSVLSKNEEIDFVGQARIAGVPELSIFEDEHVAPATDLVYWANVLSEIILLLLAVFCFVLFCISLIALFIDRRQNRRYVAEIAKKNRQKYELKEGRSKNDDILLRGYLYDKFVHDAEGLMEKQQSLSDEELIKDNRYFMKNGEDQSVLPIFILFLSSLILSITLGIKGSVYW